MVIPTEGRTQPKCRNLALALASPSHTSPAPDRPPPRPFRPSPRARPEAVLPETERSADNLLGGSFLKHFIYRMDLTAGELHLTQLAPTAPAAVMAARPLRTSSTTRPVPRGE